MAVYAAEPGERCRMPVEHGDDAAMGRHVRKQALDMRARVLPRDNQDERPFSSRLSRYTCTRPRSRTRQKT